MLGRRPGEVAPPEQRRSPGMWIAAAAMAFFIASQLRRWGWWNDLYGTTSDVGYISQSAVGLSGTITTLVLTLVIRARSGSTSGFRLVQVGPLALGLIALLLALSGYEQTTGEMNSHLADGVPAGLDAGLWLALTGGALAFLAGVLATRARLRAPLHRDARGVTARELLPDAIASLVAMVVWLFGWVSLNLIGGMWLGMFGLVASAVVGPFARRWLLGDSLRRHRRGDPVDPVPMERLQERGPNR